MANTLSVEELKAGVSLSALFERDGHALKKVSGSDFKCRCPFHQEKSASCVVHEDRGFFKCFGCGAGGTIFEYWALSRGMDARAQFAETFGNISRRHRVINSLFAETWDDERAVDDDPIKREHYGLDILPGTVTRLAKVDVQESHFWAVIRAFEPPSAEKPNGESWQLFADRIETIQEVVAIMDEFKVERKHVSMDMGKWPNKVAKWIVQYGFRGMWGDDKRGFVHAFENGMRVTMLWSPMMMRDPHLGTPYQSDANTKAMYVKWANDPIKDVLLTLRYSNPSIFHVNANAHKDYQRHMNAEQPVLIKNPRRGNYSRHWKQFSRHNHLHDCECGCLVRALMLGLVPMPDSNPGHQRQQTLDLGAN